MKKLFLIVFNVFCLNLAEAGTTTFGNTASLTAGQRAALDIANGWFQEAVGSAFGEGSYNCPNSYANTYSYATPTPDIKYLTNLQYSATVTTTCIYVNSPAGPTPVVNADVYFYPGSTPTDGQLDLIINYSSSNPIGQSTCSAQYRFSQESSYVSESCPQT